MNYVKRLKIGGGGERRFPDYGPWKKARLKKRRALREKCSNTEFFLVRIFLYSD